MLVPVSAAAPVPWKNGGGVTRELLRVPAAGDDWTLRISLADIAADGPFSAFPGVTRWFAVVAGAGVRLGFPDRALDVRPGDAPLRFDGAEAPACRLLDGPTRDLNVMVRDDRASVAVTPAAPGDETWAARCAGLGFFARRPTRLHGGDGPPVDMPALSLLWQAPPFGQARPWTIAPLPGEPAASPGGHGWWISLNAPGPSDR